MTKHENLRAIFELGRVIAEDSPNPYLHIAFIRKLKNYRLISSGELSVRGRGLDIPDYMYEFLRFHNEAVMIANIIDNKVISIVLRSLGPRKEFMKVGVSKNMLYGLGDLEPNFTFGTPIVLVEGHLDRDVMCDIYPNTLALTTNKISSSQRDILTSLTNKFILMLDNDEAGEAGTRDAYYKLKGNKIVSLRDRLKERRIKDCGDILKLEKSNREDYEYIKNICKMMIEYEIN